MLHLAACLLSLDHDQRVYVIENESIASIANIMIVPLHTSLMMYHLFMNM